MALFGIGKKEKKADSIQSTADSGNDGAKAAAVGYKLSAVNSVLIRPRITEKTGNLTATNVYTFDVAITATKRTVAAAIEAEYKVKPIAVRIVTRKSARVRLRTRRGYGATKGGKKAYVTVKKGDRIEFSS